MINATNYTENAVLESKHQLFEDVWNERVSGAITWINLSSDKIEDFEKMVTILDLHPLMVEDIHHKSPLPKFEMFEELGFLALKMLRLHPLSHQLLVEHVSLIVGSNYVISIQDGHNGDVFDHVRSKINLNHKRMFKAGHDYLFLSLVDAIVDEYLAVVETYRGPIEDLELMVVKKPAMNFMPNIQELKAGLAQIRKYTLPLKDELQRIRADNPTLIKKHNHALFRDILDHVNGLSVNFDNFREMLRDITDLHHSNQNLVLNNTIKTLTVISAIFIPLTFLVGVWGMNFEHMPEIKWKYGYAFAWSIMLLIAGGLIVYMKKKKWF